jgi:hypothetical protein
LDAISAFLRGIADEADARGYTLDRAKMFTVIEGPNASWERPKA